MAHRLRQQCIFGIKAGSQLAQLLHQLEAPLNLGQGREGHH